MLTNSLHSDMVNYISNELEGEKEVRAFERNTDTGEIHLYSD